MNRRSLYFTGPSAAAIRSTSVEMADDEVLVETRVSGISAGTELLIYRGDAPTDLPADETLEALDGDLSFPVRYGYAAVGDVIEAGPDADDGWVGRTVFGFTPHENRFSLPPEQLIPVPDAIDPEAMAMFPSVETATSLALDGRPRVGEEVVVFGAGVVGLCTIGVLSSFPLRRLIAVEPLESRRERAREMGADVAVAPDALDDVLDTGRDSTGHDGPERDGTDFDSTGRDGPERDGTDFDGTGRDGPDFDGADLVYELSGQPATLDDAVAAAGYDGRVVVGSWYGDKPATLDLGSRFHRDRIAIESSQVSTLAPETRGRWSKQRRAETAVERLRELDAGDLVTHRVPFADAPDAYRLLDRQTDGVLQVLLTYE